MTVANAISALSALDADGLKTVDEATLERLRGLAHDCLTLITDEKVRRNPEPKFEGEAWEVIQARRVRALYEAEMAKRKKLFEEWETTLQEAITLCASKPDLQSRLKTLFVRRQEMDE